MKYETLEMEIIEFTEEEISTNEIELSGDVMGASLYTDTVNRGTEC